MVTENKSLGKFELTNIRPAPRGVPQIEITFDIDADGILTVSAKDLDTGEQTGITIMGSTGLSEKEVAEMISAAEAAEADDLARLDEITARNNAESTLHRADRVLNAFSGQLTDRQLQHIKKTMLDLRRALHRDDSSSDYIRAMTNELAEAISELGYSKSKYSPPGISSSKHANSEQKGEGRGN